MITASEGGPDGLRFLGPVASGAAGKFAWRCLEKPVKKQIFGMGGCRGSRMRRRSLFIFRLGIQIF
jgi:acyl dehydratase